ncbi:helix-turn-helix domain-containing protein [Streptosporangium sp. NPDC004631]
MRYSDRSGELSGAERQRREALRLRATDMFCGGITAPRVAQLLGVTRKPAFEWHRTWLKGGKDALVLRSSAGIEIVIAH